MIEHAPAKFNLCLFLGPLRGDGRHELATIIEPLELGDSISSQPAERDEVICPGIDGPNLAATALELFRRAHGGAPLRLTIEKRTPVAAGMGGGSSDAAAALRIAARAAGLEPADRLLEPLARRVGSDVSALVGLRRALATGAGERVESLEPADEYGVLVIPSAGSLRTGDVFAEADRLGQARGADALAERLASVRRGVGSGRFGLADELIVNDLEPAALSLMPAIEVALRAARETGADNAFVSGSGPTVIGLFGRRADAVRAAGDLASMSPRPIATAALLPGVPGAPGGVG